MMKTQQPSFATVYLVDGGRTPFLKARGVPGPFTACDLGVSSVKTLLARQPFAPDQLDEVIVGCVLPRPEEVNIARIIALRSGCGKNVPAWTVQRNCASGLQAIESARQTIASGEAHLIVAGGTESMSHAPWMWGNDMMGGITRLSRAKGIKKKLEALCTLRPKHLLPVSSLKKALSDPIVPLSMGQTAEELAYFFHIPREEMDQYALESHQRAVKAQSEELLAEISPLYSTTGEVFEADNGVRRDISLEVLSKLKPVFDPYGTITAGNSSQITDGAAFVLLASESAVTQYALPVLAKVVSGHWAALDPAWMGLGPVHAMTPLLQKQNVSLEDIDHIEMNEAFAAQVLACCRAWEDADYCKRYLNLSSPMGALDKEILNPEGGAIALGHPVGASGARLVLHAAKMLAKKKKQRALVSLCIGGGQGGALLLERVSEG